MTLGSGRLRIAVILGFTLLWTSTPAAAQQPSGESTGIRVVVALAPPQTKAGEDDQADMVAEAQSDVLASPAAGDFELIHRFEVVPGMVGMADQESLDAMSKDPRVLAIAPDMPVYAALGESTTLINANRVWTDLGFTGAGVNVAVLDSGVDLSHPDLADSIVAQHCFNHGTCPPNKTEEGDSAMDENGHGTHVAGIITSDGIVSPLGVAPDAGIVAVRVLNDAGSGWTSDVVAGIDWVVAHQAEYNIRVMNLSLGGGAYPDVCDGGDANTMLYASAVLAARQAGIVAFAASGNSGLPQEMMTPACVTGAVAVGGTYDADLGSYSWGPVTKITCVDNTTAADAIACTTNSSPILDLLAPGAAIVSPELGGGASPRSGTSMATPHASAVAALMLQARASLTPDEIEQILKATGVQLTDSRNSRLTPRLDAMAAVRGVSGDASPAGDGPIGGTIMLQNRAEHAGVSVLVSPAPCPLPTGGVPTVVTNSSGHFELATSQGEPAQCLQASYPGFLTGQRTAPQGSLGTIMLPAGDVNADQVIDIFDLAFMASRYGNGDQTCDVNGDGNVDIFDLAVAAGNYGRQGPVTNWQ